MTLRKVNDPPPAFPISVKAKDFTRLRVKAPSGTPTEPGPWLPYEGSAGEMTETQYHSASVYVFGPGASADEVAATSDVYLDYGNGVAWLESDPDPDTGGDDLYCETGITTLVASDLVVSSSSQPVLNRPGVEYDVGGAGYTWHLRATFGSYVLDETDALAAQVEDLVLKVAVVPDSYVELDGEGIYSGHPEDHQYRWTEWPTDDLLHSLTEVLSAPFSVAGGTWATNGSVRQTYVSFDVDVDIPSSMLTGGRVHLGYWLEKSDGTRTGFGTHYSSMHSSTVHNNIASLTSGPQDTSSGNYAIADGAASLTGYPSSVGYFSTDGEEVWCPVMDGTGHFRIFYTSGLLMNYMSAPVKTMRWTFSQVSTTDFGISLFTAPWSLFFVVTAAEVVYWSSGVRTVLATHTTPFASGDVAECFLSGNAMSVRRNGVEVSSVVVPDDVAPYYFYTFPYAESGNAGNRTTGYEIFTPPTDRGPVAAYVYMDYDQDGNDSSFSGATPTRYRYLYAAGYPRFVEESNSWYGNTQVAWLRVSLPASSVSVYGGWVNTTAVDDPELPYDDWPNQRGFDVEVAVKARSGYTVEIDRSVAYEDGFYPHYPWEFSEESKGFFKYDNFSNDFFYRPQESTHLNRAYPYYLRVVVPQALYNQALDDDWADLQLYAWPFPAVPTSLKVWSWQPGDDHEGLQGLGYAHDVTDVTTVLTELTTGVAFLVADNSTGTPYANRDSILGYNEDVGVFSYGRLPPGATMTQEFDEDSIITYGDNITSDDDGRIVAALDFNQLWTGQPVTGSDYSVTGVRQEGLQEIRNQNAMPKNVGRAVVEVEPWPVTTIGGSPYDSWEELTFIFVRWSPAYEQSLFVLLQVYRADTGYAFRQFEIDKDTGAVVREMTPFLDPLGASSGSDAWTSSSYETVVSEDGSRLIAHWTTSGGVDNLREYDLASETIVASSVLPFTHTGEPVGTLSNGWVVYMYRRFEDRWWYLHNPTTDAWVEVQFDPYEGKGYGGGAIGFDGRYVWAGELNYHVDPNQYRLSSAEVAGTGVPAGTVVDVGGGVAQAFTEFYRYDLEALVHRPSLLYLTAFYIYIPAFNPHSGAEGMYYSWVNGVETNYHPELFVASVFGDMSVGSSAWGVHIESTSSEDGSAGTVTCFVNPYTGEVDTELWASSMWYGPSYGTYDINYTESQDWDFTDVGLSGYTDETFTSATVEYVFNLDYEEPQSFCSKVFRMPGFGYKNLLTLNQWNATTLDGFTPTTYLSVDPDGGVRATVPAGEVVTFTVGPVSVLPPNLPVILSSTFFRASYEQDAPISSYTYQVRLRIRDAGGASLYDGPWSSGGLTIAASGYLYPDKATIELEIEVTAGADDAAVRFYNIGIYDDASYRMISPAEGDQGSRWGPESDAGLHYRFPNQALPATFAPPKPGEWSVGYLQGSDG